MTETGAGRIVTFYSYKGGTGRTMALANVAWILAANGKRVLVADWDLESPGLHRFFKPFLDPETVRGSSGIVDLIRTYEWETTRDTPRPERWHEEYAKVGRHAFSVAWPFPDGGTLDFLSAGLQNQDYAVSVIGLDWDTFWDRLGGAQFFDALREDMRRHYDYTLIDSRTGLSDVADICTVHLPDTLVDCFTLSDQGILGAAHVAHTVQTRYNARNSRQRPIRVLPVPMRVDQAENDKANAGRLLARSQFAGLPTGMTDEQRRRYWAAVEVPYQTYYAYEEMLATFGDDPNSPRLLLSAYERLTSYITDGDVTGLPPMDDAERLREVARFTRKPPEQVEEEIVLRYAPADQVWAEWVEWVLGVVGVRVVEPGEAEAGGNAPRALAIVSTPQPGLLTTRDRTAARQPLVVYVADARPLLDIPAEASASIAGRDEQAAAERIMRLLGRPIGLVGDAIAGSVRYPRTEPAIFQAPVRNARFTGREEELRALRARLKAGRSAVVLPVTLQGMGGVGKTQVAMEYVHRFRSAYDIVWWIPADQPQFIDASLADLGVAMSVPLGATAADTAKATLEALKRRDRWLIVFDNAEDIEQVDRFRPQGNGHVLITSRNEGWANRTDSVPIDVFQRHESVAHLLDRLPTASRDDADQIAEALSDLPIAVANAGAWLAETGTPVAEYLAQLERGGVGGEAAWRQTWDLSLDRLSDQSPGAYRLLQLCSVLASEIALDLVYSDEMASAITPYDQSVSERQMLASLVQKINRLALLKVDTHARQIHVHRLIQAAVRDRMTSQERAEARHEVHLVLARSKPGGDVDNPENWPRLRMIWPHLAVSAAVSCQDEQVRQLLIDRLRYLWRRGDLEQGIRFGHDIETKWSRLRADDPEFSPGSAPGQALYRQLLHLRFHVANVLWSQGEFGEARRIDEEVYAKQVELLGAEHPHALMTAGSLASNLRGQGRYAEALPMDRDTHAAWVRVFGDDYSRTLAAANNLATTYRLVGDFRAARDLDHEVYERRQVVLGEDNPYTRHSASQLARDLREAGEYERSYAMLEQVFEAFRKDARFGPDALDTLKAQANLAVSLRSIGRGGQAARLLDDAYERLRDLFGQSNQDTLACRLSRAATLVVIGDKERGTQEARTVLAVYRERFGPAHPHAIVCLNNMSGAARMSGAAEEARDLATEAAEQFEKVLGEEHPYTLAARMNQAICLVEVGDGAKARDLLRVTALRMAEALGADHPDTLSCQTHLAVVSRRLDEPGAAGTYARALERLAGVLGTDHPIVTALREGQLVYRVLDPHPF
ncbi:FxSxx-COOH system tetratricopeptide repeat protein [Phytohabitans kaempferiae]|uniref:FxSxx-COOH system tetratricopeptide repeat protein n=1 Tax=Phytohabitans kaempferiae TaxID=1620943 RepID=A0ABV6MDH6_9ACTN